MLDNTSRYIYEIYRCKSVSKAAEKLFISQPALSKTLKNCEEKLGAPIFNRKTHPFSLTPEGKLYIETLEKIMSLESDTYQEIRNVSQYKTGTLKIGVSTILAYNVVPKICEMFLIKYPDIDINIIYSATDNLYRLLKTEEAHIIFLPTFTAPDEYICESLFEEKFVVGVRKEYVQSENMLQYALTYDEIIKKTYSSKKELDSVDKLKTLEFIHNPPSSHIYKKRKLMIAGSEFNPHIATSSNNYTLNHNLMLAGLGALLTTDANLATMPPDDKCAYFVIKQNDVRECFSMVYLKSGNSASYKLTKEFSKTAKNLFSSDNCLTNLKP